MLYSDIASLVHISGSGFKSEEAVAKNILFVSRTMFSVSTRRLIIYVSGLKSMCNICGWCLGHVTRIYSAFKPQLRLYLQGEIKTKHVFFCNTLLWSFSIPSNLQMMVVGFILCPFRQFIGYQDLYANVRVCVCHIADHTHPPQSHYIDTGSTSPF